MRLPHLSKTQKKVAIGGAAGLTVLTLTWLALRSPKKKSNGTTGTDKPLTLTAAKTSRVMASPPPADSTDRIAKRNQRVLSWPASSNKLGMAYVKFTDGAHVRGGWVSDSAVLRDSEQTPWNSPAPMQGFSGVGAIQVQVPSTQQQVIDSRSASSNATIIKDSLMFAKPEDKANLESLQKQYFALVGLMGSGNGLIIPDEGTFRKVYMHGVSKVLGLIPSIFYTDNKFTKNNLSQHAHCQTWAAQVVNFQNDFLWPFYNQNVYRYPSNNPNYAGVPIDPHADPGAWQAALNAAIESNVQSAMQRASFGMMLDQIEQIMGTPAFGIIFGKDAPRDVFILEVQPDIIDGLARFGYDFANDKDALKGTDEKSKAAILATVNGQVGGKQISGNQLKSIQASIGTFIASGVIDMFESHDPKVNPCIRELNFDLVLSMLIAVVTVFLAVVSLGSAGLLGPVIQAVYWSFYTAPNAIKGLADLSK